MKITGSNRAYSEIVVLEGRLDGNSSTQLELYLQEIDPLIKEVILDLGKLTYISSMGLRVILQEYKLLTKHRKKLTITNIPDAIRSIFEMSGFIQTFISEEKLVVVVKDNPNGSLCYSLGGILDAETIPSLATVIAKIESVPTRKLEIFCDKLQSISLEGCEALKKVSSIMKGKNGVLKLMDVPEHIIAESRKFGFDAFLKETGDVSYPVTPPLPSPTGVSPASAMPKTSSSNGTEMYTFSGAWAAIELPMFDAQWIQQHAQTKKIVIDLKGATGITTEGFAALMDIKKRCAELSIHLELIM